MSAGRLLRILAVFASCFPVGLLAQQSPSFIALPTPAPPNAQEFPVMMRQSVTAGKTPVGTKVQAILGIATLVSGKVIPDGAVFSGVVVESAAKSAAGPSRLSIRMDSAQWKTGSLALTTYLTQWYHPMRLTLGEDRFDDRPDANGEHSKRTWAAYNPNPSDAVLFPNDSNQAHLKTAPPPAMSISERRVTIKDVQLEKDSNGEQILVSTRSNIKLDKSTTYVLSNCEPPGK
jgi:hypothetical protein